MALNCEHDFSSDLIVALSKLAILRRPDLKLILMSATINIELFQSYFDDAPVITVPGRLFPIEVHYIAVREYDTEKKATKIDAGPYLQILQVCLRRADIWLHSIIQVFRASTQNILPTSAATC